MSNPTFEQKLQAECLRQTFEQSESHASKKRHQSARFARLQQVVMRTRFNLREFRVTAQ